MLKQGILSAALVMLTAGPALAQRVEVGAIVGWTFSDGVSGDPVLALDGNIYDHIDLKDSFSWGFNVGALVTEQAEVGFLYGQQMSVLEAGGTRTVEVGDINVNTYHGYFGYNFGTADSPVRPYVLFGLGATNYPSVSFTGVTGVARETVSETQFSTTWGAGVKLFPGGGRAGVRVGAAWTPTYIKSDAAGWWCDPWWGCYLVGDAQYSNQFQFNGGVTFRF
jgi:OprF membrane domain